VAAPAPAPARPAPAADATDLLFNALDRGAPPPSPALRCHPFGPSCRGPPVCCAACAERVGAGADGDGLITKTEMRSGFSQPVLAWYYSILSPYSTMLASIH
jgi:hypothetical protein